MGKTIDFKCPGCEAAGECKRESRVCVSKRPELKEDILSGSFFEWKCPECQKRFFVDDVFLYNDDEKKFMVYYVPGYDKDTLEIPTVLKTDKDYDTQNSILRVCSGFIDFVEKIRILEDGLDDRAIEAMKAVYSAVYDETGGGKVYNMIYEERGENTLCFAVFLEDDDFIAEIPFEAYQKTKDDFSSLFNETKGQFIKIDQAWLKGTLGQGD